MKKLLFLLCLIPIASYAADYEGLVNPSTGAGYTLTLPLTHENGGLEADVSAYDGLIKISGGSTSAVSFLDEDDMSSDSASAIPSQQSVKAYVDANAGGSGATGWISFDTSLYFESADNDTVVFEAGDAEINGATVSWTDITDDFTSGTAPLNSTGLIYVYLWDNAGADLAYSPTAPNWDASLKYWKSGTLTSPVDAGGNAVTPGTAARFVGTLLRWQETTTSTYRLVPFVGYARRGEAEIYYENDYFGGSNHWSASEQVVVSGGSATTQTAFTPVSAAAGFAIAPISVMTAAWLAPKLIFTNDGDDVIIGIGPRQWDTAYSPPGGQATYTARASAGRASTRTFFGRVWMPYIGGNWYYALQNLTGTGSCDISLHAYRFSF